MRCRIQALDRRQGSTAPLQPRADGDKLQGYNATDWVSLCHPCVHRCTASPGMAGVQFHQGEATDPAAWRAVWPHASHGWVSGDEVVAFVAMISLIRTMGSPILALK